MTDVEIVNLALDHLGITNKITALTDQTDPAKAANRWYATIKQELIRKHPWTFQGAEKRAALVEDAVNVHPQYEYAYELPADMLKPRKLIIENYRNVPPQWEMPFLIGNIEGGTGRRLYTDLANAVLAYTPDPVATVNFPGYFCTALSYQLAEILIAPLRVANKLVIDRVLYGRAEAMASAVIEDKGQHQKDPDPDPSWILERY